MRHPGHMSSATISTDATATRPSTGATGRDFTDPIFLLKSRFRAVAYAAMIEGVPMADLEAALRLVASRIAETEPDAEDTVRHLHAVPADA
jgi:hypothetical protein